ncbi:unnamed protein product [Lathyrus oleraceus]
MSWERITSTLVGEEHYFYPEATCADKESIWANLPFMLQVDEGSEQLFMHFPMTIQLKILWKNSISLTQS